FSIMPEILSCRGLYLLRRLGVGRRVLLLAEGVGEASGSHQPCVGGSDSVGVDAVPLLPEVPRSSRKTRVRLAIAHHEIGSILDQWAVERADELDLAKEAEVLPEGIDNQRSLVLLNGELRGAVGRYPGVPTTAPRTLRRKLVQQIASLRHDVSAEVEERAGDVAVARGAEPLGYQGAVAWPHVGVTVAREPPHVAVGGGDDRAVVVYLRADDEQAALVEVEQRLGEVAKGGRPVVDPEPPVIRTARKKAFRAALAHQHVKIADDLEAGAEGKPGVAGGRLTRRKRAQVEASAAIH